MRVSFVFCFVFSILAIIKDYVYFKTVHCTPNDLASANLLYSIDSPLKEMKILESSFHGQVAKNWIESSSLNERITFQSENVWFKPHCALYLAEGPCLITRLSQVFFS